MDYQPNKPDSVDQILAVVNGLILVAFLVVLLASILFEIGGWLHPEF
jgi:hypothetical protein